MTHEEGGPTPGPDGREGSRPRPDFSRLSPTQLQNGIEDGTITDPAAVHVLVREQLDSERQVYRSADYRREIEERYAPLLTGSPRITAHYCQRQADEYMTFGYEGASDHTDYPAAARWYDMAARFAYQAADREEKSTSAPPCREPAAPGDRKPDEQREQDTRRSPAVLPQPGVLGAPTERIRRAAEANAAARAILDGIEDGSITDPKAVQDLAAWQLEGDRATLRGDLRKQTEAAYAPLLYGKPQDLVRFCLDEAHARLGGDTPGSVHVDGAAAGRRYAMAARFAWQAERERRTETE